MTRYRNASELPSHLREQVDGKGPAKPAGAAKRSKYGNQAVLMDGQRFDSKLEADRYQYLRLMVVANQVRWFVRQVNFMLPGGIKYRADFVEIWDAGNGMSRAEVTDTKGVLTRDCINKLKQVEACHGIAVTICTRKGTQWIERHWRDHAAA